MDNSCEEVSPETFLCIRLAVSGKMINFFFLSLNFEPIPFTRHMELSRPIHLNYAKCCETRSYTHTSSTNQEKR